MLKHALDYLSVLNYHVEEVLIVKFEKQRQYSNIVHIPLSGTEKVDLIGLFDSCTTKNIIFQ